MLLEIEDIHFGYQKEKILKGISFSVNHKEFIGIIGPNGSGKTTLLKLIGGIFKPQKGKIKIKDTDINNFSKKELAQIVSIVPQINYLPTPFSVWDIVMMGRSPYLKNLQFESKKDFKIVEKSMELTKIIKLKNRTTEQLSGGELQRVFIARSIAQEPELILMDEPIAFLDLKHQLNIFSILKKLNNEQGLTIITVMHDINMAAQFCHRILMIKNGKIFQEGKTEDILNSKNISHLYEVDAMVDKNPFTKKPRITLLIS
ncbi:MAG: ABC transporter ATP-binding protein [Deltaproteobacteria bacterium]|nr:ABC transporter ATP-binding protein [Deltaproteobacteria bacterium]